ncbi:hypothetical protein SDC9_130414 [bioreactor metagenome]|uniref:DUF1836 domain-containing protein n=1 Tax=bioreactor metagenome TaxID=1076179 RepID=A0A645D1G0_9ZZZZ
MDNRIQEIEGFLKTLNRNSIVSYDQMPDIELYMDQVMTFMERNLNILFQNDIEKILTPAMINNYVKNGIIKRPNHKKYNREHLCSLLMLCMFKQVLPINQCHLLLKDAEGNTDKYRYNMFFVLQNEIMRKTAQKTIGNLKNIPEEGKSEKEELKMLAMRFVIEADILSTFAKKILSTLEGYEDKTKSKTKTDNQL